MRKALSHVCLLLFVVTTMAGLSGAQLTKTATGNHYGCPTTLPDNETTYSNWVYKDASGVSHYFNGTDLVEFTETYIINLKIPPVTCGVDLTTSLDAYSTDGEYYLQAKGATGTVTAQNPVIGFVNPKYVVVGVTYAPPGPSSNVTYTNSTLVGTTTTTTSSFTNDLGVTVSVSGGIGIWTIVGGAGVKMTDTDATDYIQGSNSSSTVTMSKQTGVSYKTSGTGNAFSPVNHDYDTIWLWLNPLFIYTVYPGTTKVQWNGYGYDPKDPSGTEGLDIFGVQVGYLNGDFGADPSITTILARGWVTTNEPGMIWPTGQGPGLTSTDIANVLAADPFSSASYTLPTLLPSTTADGRFTQEAYPPNPIEYAQAGLGNGGGLTTTYNAVYVNTESVAQGTTNTFKQAVGTELAFSGGTWFNTWTLDIKTTDTLTWTNTWLNTLTTTNTLTDALSVTGPGCPQTSPPCVPAYAGPGQFVAFQDNQYGTFMFYPAN